MSTVESVTLKIETRQNLAEKRGLEGKKKQINRMTESSVSKRGVSKKALVYLILTSVDIFYETNVVM